MLLVFVEVLADFFFCDSHQHDVICVFYFVIIMSTGIKSIIVSKRGNPKGDLQLGGVKIKRLQQLKDLESVLADVKNVAPKTEAVLE